MTESVMDWQARMDMLGPFCRIEALGKGLEAAPRIAWNTPEYGYLLGLYLGRHPSDGILGGLAVVMQTISENHGEDEGEDHLCSELRQGMADGRAIRAGKI